MSTIAENETGSTGADTSGTITTSVRTSRSIDHILRKYPEILGNLDNELGKREPGATIKNSNHQQYYYQHNRILRSATSKTLRASRSRKAPHVRHLRGRLLRRMLQQQQQGDGLFSCLKCKGVLEGPVTLECGHTFCKGCALVAVGCFVCSAEVDANSRKSTNILVQDVVAKWKEIKDSYDAYCNGENDITRISASDFECILCSQCLLDPVTTSCGHTFCRSCLARVLDHGLACPLCMSILKTTDLNRKPTEVLIEALQILIPEEHKKRLLASQNEETDMLGKKSQVPVFVCTNAFPGVACPLFVYEPRYRLLTRRCLQSTVKRFAMAVSTRTDEKFASYGTLLEVRDAVYMPDGTSILTTVGLRRFKVLTRGEKDGYDTAEIQYIKDGMVSREKLPPLVALHESIREKAINWVHSLNHMVFKEIERSLGPMPNVEKDWATLPDGPAWAWWLMPILPLNPQLQLGFLSSTSLEKRLRAIDKLLDHLNSRIKMVDMNSSVKCVTTVVDSSNQACSFNERSIDIA